jgi:nucleotide-binding universal stress UspA family protein
MKNVLVAVDGSPYSLTATVEAARLCRTLGARLTLLHVGTELETLSVPEMRIAEPDVPPVLRNEKEAQRILDEASAAARADGVQPTAEVRWANRLGSAAHEIVKAAKEGGHDLIVVGPRGHTPILGIVLGSVSNSVVTHAECSVLVVRAGS